MRPATLWRNIALHITIPLLYYRHVEQHRGPAKWVPTWGDTGPTTTTAKHLVSSSSSSSTPWYECLSQPRSRSAMSEAAESCLAQERPRLYAFYRPAPPISNLSSPSSTSSLLLCHSTPSAFVALIDAVSSMGLGAQYGTRLVELFLEILRKPINPSHAVASPWDMSEADMVRHGAASIQRVAVSMKPSEALAWISRWAFGHGDRQCEADGGGGEEDIMAIPRAITERLQCQEASSSRKNFTIKVRHQQMEALLVAPPVVAAVAACFLRLRSDDDNGADGGIVGGRRQVGLDLLEVAASARLCNGPHRRMTQLVEEVAVHCAEAAATVGDVEMVTRIMFLLYRSHGALASGGADAAAMVVQSGHVPWWDRLWIRHRRTAVGMDTSQFEKAAAHLLVSCVRAIIIGNDKKASRHYLDTSSSSRMRIITEAVQFYDKMRHGTHWEASVGMAVEILTHIAKQQQQQYVQCDEEAAVLDESLVSLAQRLLRDALRLLGALAKHAEPSHAEATRKALLAAACIQQVMRTCVPEIHCWDGDTMTISCETTQRHHLCVPLYDHHHHHHRNHAYEVLALFRLVLTNSATAVYGEALLPFALAAALRVVQDVSARGDLHPEDGDAAYASSLSALCDYFSRVQTPAHYVADARPDADPRSGSLILLIALSMTQRHVRDGSTARLAEKLGGCVHSKASSGLTTAAIVELFVIAAPAQRCLVWTILSQVARLMATTTTTTTNSVGVTQWHRDVQASLAQLLPMYTSSLQPSEEETALFVDVLYAYGLPSSVVQEKQSPHHVKGLLSAYLGMPVCAASLEEIAQYAQCSGAGQRRSVVLVVCASALQRDRHCTSRLSLEESIRRDIIPEIKEEEQGADVPPYSTSASTTKVVVVVLTASALAHLRGVRRLELPATPLSTAMIHHMEQQGRHDEGKKNYCCGVGVGCGGLRIVVGSPGGAMTVSGRDDMLAATHVARCLSATTEVRADVLLWDEGDACGSEGRAELRRHYGVRLVSRHRTLIARAGREILQQRSSLGKGGQAQRRAELRRLSSAAACGYGAVAGSGSGNGSAAADGHMMMGGTLYKKKKFILS